jgi:hypothetical protein
MFERLEGRQMSTYRRGLVQNGQHSICSDTARFAIGSQDAVVIVRNLEKPRISDRKSGKEPDTIW